MSQEKGLLERQENEPVARVEHHRSRDGVNVVTTNVKLLRAVKDGTYLYARPVTAGAPVPLYTCSGKGGEYELIGQSAGAGTRRGETLKVYRDTHNGLLFHRTPEEFDARMAKTEPSSAGAGPLAPAAGPDLLHLGSTLLMWNRRHDNPPIKPGVEYQVAEAVLSMLEAQPAAGQSVAYKCPSCGANAEPPAPYRMHTSCPACGESSPASAARAAAEQPGRPDQFELEDLARSAFDEAMAFGVSLDSFIRLANRVAKAVQPAPAEQPHSQAALDVLDERRRQVEAKGWTPAYDDEHANGEMATAAASYAIRAHSDPRTNKFSTPGFWPWPNSGWKPGTPRRMLVKAGALILAEIERLDRTEKTTEGEA